MRCLRAFFEMVFAITHEYTGRNQLQTVSATAPARATQFRILGVLCSLAFLVCSQSLFAAAPRFTDVSPRAGTRGQELTITLSGSNLEDAEELLLYDDGLEVLSIEHPEDDKEKNRKVLIRLKVAEDCRLGTQRMRIRTRTGLSDLQNFVISPFEVLSEKEPNTDFATPQEVTLNSSVVGRIDREDVDYFVINAKQGERISAEVFGTRIGASTGINYFDPYLAIIDEDRFEIAVNDDAPLVLNDAVVSAIAPRDGRYIIQVRDSSYNGDGRADYVLSIGNFPRPTAVIPSGGKPGETLTVTFLGDPLGPITQDVTLPSDPKIERFGLEVRDEFGLAPSLQPFQLSSLDNTTEAEPNNDRKAATACAAPGAANGVISEPGDIDYFKFTAKKDQQFDIEVYARRLRSGLDPVVTVVNTETGKGVVSNDDSRGPDSYVRFKAPEDGEYSVGVYDHLRRGQADFTYRIEISPIEPSLQASPTEFARYVQHQIIIPQGAGSGIVANVQRKDIGGAVNFRSADLPEGVRVECPEGWRNDGSMSVVFFADANAPLSGKFSSIETFLDDPKQPDRVVTGPLYQDVLMVRGRNNNRVWEERMNRLPIVVTQKAPFRVWAEAPPVPIVRGGSLNLVVKCEKDEGWDEDISVRLLQNPPGINSSGSVKIAKGQTEASIPINAAGNAALRESMISLRCTANIGNGAIELCTEFIPLRVEDQYATFEFVQSAVEQGKEVTFPVKVNKQKDFAGSATVELLGLPANATAEKLEMTAETTELNFKIQTTEKTPPGMSKNVFCRVMVPENGATILHNLGSGVLRVDKPLPPKPDAPKPAPEVAKAPPAEKPLSRLEQLRLQKRQQAEAAQAESGD
ncbi:PPC domain-containing protein [Thalassoglobus sp. JC818]|uniref:PPC domain-containing protein n=1 Tax=Thalassoglobus sp. JC818 TaxID=3232136 RepID=UPI003458ACCA